MIATNSILVRLTILASLFGWTTSQWIDTAWGRHFVFSRIGDAQIVITAKDIITNVQLKVNGVLDPSYVINGGTPLLLSKTFGTPTVVDINTDRDVQVQLYAEVDFYPETLTLVLPTNVLDNGYAIMGVLNYWDSNEEGTVRVTPVENETTCTLATKTTAVTFKTSDTSDYSEANQLDYGGSSLRCDKKVFVYDFNEPYIPYDCGGDDSTMELNLPRQYFSRDFALVPLTTSCKNDTPIACCNPVAQFQCQPCQQFFRVLALKNNTQGNVSAPTGQQFTLGANEFKDVIIPESDTAWLTSDKPVAVTQFQSGSEYSGAANSGPMAVTVIPRNAYLAGYTFAACFNIAMKNFLRVDIETTEKDGLLLAGNRFLLGKSGVPIFGTNYSSFYHELTCTVPLTQMYLFHLNGKPFALTVYAYGQQDAHGSIVGIAQPGLNLNLTLNVINETVVIEQCNINATFEIEPPEIDCESECCNVMSPPTFEDSITNDGCQKVINRTWSATDMCNRTSTASQVIIITQKLDEYEAPPEKLELSSCDDMENLALTAQPTRKCESSCGTTVNVTKSDHITKPGEIIRTWTVEHKCGNLTTFSQNITCPPTCTPPTVEDIPMTKIKVCHWKEHVKLDKPKVHWDKECCNGSLNWTSTQHLMSKDACSRFIRVTWMVTDGCGVSVSKEQLLVLEKHLDQYKEPKNEHLEDCSELNQELHVEKPNIKKDCGTTESVRHIDEKVSNGLIRFWRIKSKCDSLETVIRQKFTCSGEPGATDAPSATPKPDDQPEKSEETKDSSPEEKDCSGSGEGCSDRSPECHGDCDFIYLENGCGCEDCDCSD